MLGASLDGAKVFLDQFLRSCHIDITGQHQHRVIRAVMLAEPRANVFHAGAIKVSHRPDRRMPVRMAFGHHALDLRVFDEAIRLGITLPLFVLYDAYLVGQIFLRYRAEQIAHAISLEIQYAVKRAGRNSLEIIGAVVPRSTIVIRRTHILQRLEEITRRVF